MWLHARPLARKPCVSRTRANTINHAINGNGNSDAAANHGSIQNNTAAVNRINRKSVVKSTRLSDRNWQMRSESVLMRDIKSPVRLPPKNSTESVIRCSYVRFRRSAEMRSPTRDNTTPCAQLNPQVAIAAKVSPPRYHSTSRSVSAEDRATCPLPGGGPNCAGINTSSISGIVR